MLATSLFSLLDFSGVAAGAFGGALEAKRHPTYKFDFVGVLGLAMISALGGGVARDILIQHGPPLALLDVRYLLVALTGGLVGLLAKLPAGSPLGKLLLVVDAAALGLFAVAALHALLTPGFSFFPHCS